MWRPCFLCLLTNPGFSIWFLGAWHPRSYILKHSPSGVGHPALNSPSMMCDNTCKALPVRETHLTSYRTTPHNKEGQVQSVSSADAEKPCLGIMKSHLKIVPLLLRIQIYTQLILFHFTFNL